MNRRLCHCNQFETDQMGSFGKTRTIHYLFQSIRLDTDQLSNWGTNCTIHFRSLDTAPWGNFSMCPDMNRRLCHYSQFDTDQMGSWSKTRTIHYLFHSIRIDTDQMST